ncbi:NAD(P)/FAD-dependent oxidoreductase [Shivajiella indica]|uniref:NAD(P)/FAD-dependent oxidoreductase n=1 Tax=Shivajiella indica TaxID=872115 RepID=A0ABW5BDC1_9BACT
MLSYWEKKNFLKYDLVVVGGGIVGLSTAIQFKTLNPDSSVMVLERGIFPSGASTKNAGFACFGSLTEILDDLEVLPKEEVLSLVERRYKGLLAIRQYFGDSKLDYRPSGGFELITPKELSQLDHLKSVNDLLQPIFKKDVFSLLKDHRDYKFGPLVNEIVKNDFEGELDSGKFLNSLWEKCSDLKVKILTGVHVDQIDTDEKKVFIKDSYMAFSLVFQAKKIAICTNAFTKTLFPQQDIKPGRGLVLVTKILPFEVSWKGSFHYDKGYVYFRNIDNRLLLGGGRNMDFEGENTTEFGINPIIRSYLLSVINEIIFPGFSTEIEMEWSGIMAFGPDKRPIVVMEKPGVGLAVRLGGMGVAIGWQTAGELVNLLQKV